MSNSSSFMPQIKNEAMVDLESGVKIRLYRQEPFKFMHEIHKWLEGLKIGKVEAFQMNTDANGWVNFAIAFREHKEVPQGPDPVMVLFDTVMALKDLTDVVNRLEQRLGDSSSKPEVPILPYKFPEDSSAA